MESSEETYDFSHSTEQNTETYKDIHHLIGGKDFIAKYPATAVPYLFIAFTASIVGTIGNVSVLSVIFVYKPLKNARNVFLVNLALADLLVTAIANPFGIIGKYLYKRFQCLVTGAKMIGYSEVDQECGTLRRKIEYQAIAHSELL